MLFILAPLSAAHEDYSDENGTYHWVVDQEASNKTVHVDDSYEEPPLEMYYQVTNRVKLADENDVAIGNKIKDIIYSSLDNLGVKRGDNEYRAYQITQDKNVLTVVVAWIYEEDYYDHIIKFNPSFTKDKILDYGCYLDEQGNQAYVPNWETTGNSEMIKTVQKAVSDYFSHDCCDDDGNELYSTGSKMNDPIDEWAKILTPAHDDIVEVPELGHWEFTPFAKDNSSVVIHQNNTNKSYAGGVYKNDSKNIKDLNKSNYSNNSNNSSGDIGQIIKAGLQHTGFNLKLAILTVVLIIIACGVVVVRIREHN